MQRHETMLIAPPDASRLTAYLCAALPALGPVSGIERYPKHGALATRTSQELAEALPALDLLGAERKSDHDPILIRYIFTGILIGARRGLPAKGTA